MNRIFVALIAAAFLAGAWEQTQWTPPAPPTPVVATALPTDHADPTVAALAQEVEKMRAADAKAAPKPTPPLAPMAKIQAAILDKAAAAVNLAIGLIGASAFFLGVMKVAEEGGMLRIIARLIRPIMVRLFPDVPPDHPARASMILNLSANALGLGNAATPLGIKAMAELDSLNPNKGTATNAMALFLAINTSSVTLLPTGVIVIRDQLGSARAADILPTTLLGTLISTTSATLLAMTLARYWPSAASVTPAEETVELPPIAVSDDDQSAMPEWASWLAIASLFAFIPLTVLYGEQIAPWLIPTLTVGMITFGAWRGVPVYEAFIRGAKEGWELAGRVIPYLVAILCAVGMVQASGLLDRLVRVLDPITSPFGLPGEALPMALIRPLSGSGAMGVLISTMQNPATGPDTYTGFLVSTINGSSETTFYVLAIYFGSVGVKRLRHALICGIGADIAGLIGSIIACQLYFRYNHLPM